MYREQRRPGHKRCFSDGGNTGRDHLTDSRSRQTPRDYCCIHGASVTASSTGPKEESVEFWNRISIESADPKKIFWKRNAAPTWHSFSALKLQNAALPK